MQQFVEWLTLAFVAVSAFHAWKTGRGALFAFLLAAGLVRENFVALREILYGFASLSLNFGKAPAMAAVIWAYSIYAALVWAEHIRPHIQAAARIALACLFMVALVPFYEPFLAALEMARWEDGTRMTAGIPWIALIGYPTFTLILLALYERFENRPGSWPSLVLGTLLGAIGHAWGLQELKNLLGW
ncbi:MAG: hypothetical protein AAF604_21615 [Acidobacteriota bacterium]